MDPQWQIEFTDEAKFYFIEHGDLTGNLLGEIELLRYFPDGLPDENYIEIEPGLFRWTILDHFVYFRKQGSKLIIAVVKPL
jgi:hypothetical protein